MGLFARLVNKLRGLRFATNTIAPNKNYVFGAIYHGAYRNYKHDPAPLIFCMWSGVNPKGNHVTHAINIHYLSEADRAWLARSLFMIKKYGQVIDGRTFYQYLKLHRISIVNIAYRVYYTQMTDYRLVSAGLTPLDKLVYPSNERFVKQLSMVLGKEKLTAAPRQVAFSETELQERIIESINSQPIQRLGTQEVSGSMGKASWLKQS